MSDIRDVFNNDWMVQLRGKLVRSLVPRKKVKSREVIFTLSVENWITYYRWHSFEDKEPETLDWLDSYLKSGDTFFDVGSNVGIYSIYAALKHPDINVISIEPEYSNLHCLKENILRNNLTGRVLPWSVAFGDKNEPSSLFVQDLTPGAALHTVSREELDITKEGMKVLWKEGVAVFKLDTFCKATNFYPNCMKIDVDGNEYQVLLGGKSIFSSDFFRSLIIELREESPEYLKCKELMLQYGLRFLERGNHNEYEVWIKD